MEETTTQAKLPTQIAGLDLDFSSSIPSNLSSPNHGKLIVIQVTSDSCTSLLMEKYLVDDCSVSLVESPPNVKEVV